MEFNLLLVQYDYKPESYVFNSENIASNSDSTSPVTLDENVLQELHTTFEDNSSNNESNKCKTSFYLFYLSHYQYIFFLSALALQACVFAEEEIYLFL